MEELIRNIISDNSVETSLKEYGQGIFIDVNTVDIMIEELKNLTVTHSSLQLKEKYTTEFEEWLQYQQKDIKFDKYILNDTYLTKAQMFEYWESDKQNL